ncbi:ATP-citrate lyase A-1 [Striga asiatica]|uniref:ATP-citrate lyase A-1 n=1 Tax=Striga asiatica TaxID=4170 RepID=A0A5A7P6B6_STRAF|nr:ATP-citrate lyase A-1 [Striga asiatica]
MAVRRCWWTVLVRVSSPEVEDDHELRLDNIWNSRVLGRRATASGGSRAHDGEFLGRSRWPVTEGESPPEVQQPTQQQQADPEVPDPGHPASVSARARPTSAIFKQHYTKMVNPTRVYGRRGRSGLVRSDRDRARFFWRPTADRDRLRRVERVADF